MKIALIGYGQMGKAIEKIALAQGHSITVRIDANEELNKLETELRQSDVAIEFTQPESAYKNILSCFDINLPVVCGTTGWLDKMPEVKRVCLEKNQSFFYASNYSIGVNIFFELNKLLAGIIEKHPSYDKVTIHESHHIRKLDAPSGTAITLAEQIVGKITRLKSWSTHSTGENMDLKSPKSNSDLPIYSTREADVPGTHVIKYFSEQDEIEIIHKAYNREGFAKGALTAALWLTDKKGFFGMEDLLSL